MVGQSLVLLSKFLNFVNFQFRNMKRMKVIKNKTKLQVSCTCTVANSFVLDDVLMLQRFQDLDLSLKVSYVLCSAVLEFLHSHDLSGAVLKRVISTHLHTAKVSLREKTNLSEQSFFI